jgi:amino acid adenylation domain-containing protein
MERLAQVEHQPPQPTVATTQHDTTPEEWTPTETCIREVLGILSAVDFEGIRRRTTIYQLGLDSISAVQIGAMLRKFGHQVVASDVIEHTTCESLARYIDTRTPESGVVVAYDLAKFQSEVQGQVLAHGIALDAVESILPCTPLQSAMMAQFLQSGGQDYFNYVDFKLEDTMSAAKLAEAWRAVSEAHPMLRTAIIAVEHDDCAFSMIQHHPQELTQVVTAASGEVAEAFSLENWRRQVSHAAAQAPHTRLWSVAVIEGKEETAMHLAIHHALYDAHSLQLILNDLSVAVAGNQLSVRTHTAEAVIDILGNVAAVAGSSADFWKNQASKVAINALPVMTPLRETPRAILTERMTSSTLLTTLEDAASTSGHTVQVIFQAAWTRVLSAYLGEDSIIFGVVLSGRNTEATRNAAFPCITTLPVIASNNISNRDLLARMLQYNTQLFKQQHQPLTRIQQLLGCPETRLFDTLLVYQKLERDSTAHRPWSVVDESANIDYPVSIEVEPTAKGELDYQITFFGDVLPKEQAVLLLRQFDAAVQHLALHPLGQETDLFKSNPELFSIVAPETAEIPTEVRFLHQFVELQALKTSDATALDFVESFDGERPVGCTYTYKELDDNGNRVAQLLLPHVKSGDIVAVYFDKCPEAYFSILGVLKAGCAFVALDPGAPRSRNEFILQDSGGSVFLTSREWEDSLDLTVDVPVIGIDKQALSSVTANPPTLTRDMDPGDVCYCLYTSGTTGTPKGCEITHDNTVQCMLAFQHIFKGHWQDDSKWLQFASLHFDVSVLEQYWSWSVGITLVAAPRDLILEDLAGTISRLGITHIDLTPSLARLLHPDDVPTLCRGVFITGGESLKQEILDVWGAKGVIYNFYGPTEATIGVTVFPRVPTTGRASNIGRQFINVGSYVLKPGTEQPVLRGAVGELCVSGRLVGKGYLKRDDLTSEKFPTLQQFGERVYRTGDLVRVLHDGCFDFLGRADDQVKLRGQRLEIGEINHAIRKEVEAVRDVATLVARNEAQQKDLLVSFIVSEDGSKRPEQAEPLDVIQGPRAAELCRQARDACRAKLPGYMVPTYVLQLPFIPLSANNKAEMKELRKLFASLDQGRLMALASSNDTARGKLSVTGTRIAKVLVTMQVVDVDRVTSDSSIFELGIDSISVLRFSRALRNGGFANASPSLILRHPILGDLAAALEVQEPTSNFDSVVAAAKQMVQACAHKHRSVVCRELGVTPDEIEYIAPCSPLQQGILSRSAIETAYFNTFQFTLAPNISTKYLREAFQRTLEALPVLRTKFVGTTEGFIQVAMRRLHLPWVDIQLGAETNSGDAIRTTRDAWIAGNQERLARPLEAVLVNSEGAHLLILHIFHGLYDANSFDLVLDRVAAEYLALTSQSTEDMVSNAGPSFLDALCYGPLQDFSNSKSFWLEHLEGSVPAPAPSQAPELSVTASQRDILFERLDTLRTRLGVTHQAMVQAAWASVLAKHRSANPTIGIIVSGRSIRLDGVENVVGPLFNTLPFHARLAAEDLTTWASLIRQCHDFNTAALAFQHVPLRDIQKWCSGGKALFDTLFSFQREEGLVKRHESLWTMVDSEPNADYPLALEATLGANGYLRLLLVAQNKEPNGLGHVMDDLEKAFDAMAKSPESRLEHISASSANGVKDAVVNGRATNGVTTNGLSGNAEKSFPWTKEAIIIRSEIAALADIDPEIVAETAPLFGLGLDSIDVIKLSARLKRLGIAIKTSDLIKAQSIQGILQHIHTRSHLETKTGAEDASRDQEIFCVPSALWTHLAGNLGEDEIVLPTTALQESMLVEMIESGFQLYFNHDILELSSSVDIPKLKDAWTTVIEGSPILRTRFLPVEAPSIKLSYCQVIGSGPSVHMAGVSLDSMDELAKVSDTATLRARKGAGQSNLLQLVFASVGSRRFLVLSIAHALYDGWSLALIHDHVQAAYEGRYRAQSLQSYQDQLQGIIFPEHRDADAFWSGFLQGATPTTFPENDVNAIHTNVVHMDEVTSSIPASEIMAFCKANAITLQTLGQACWAAILAAKTRSLDVTFGVVLSCRDTESLEELVFPTMNTVAIRSVLHGTVSSWLTYMQDNATNISGYQQFPLREAQKLAKSNGPLFNTLFIQQRGHPPPHQQGTHPLMRSVSGTAAVEYPVCVEMEMAGSSLIWRIACDDAYASRDKTSRILLELEQILGHVIRSPESDVVTFAGGEVSVCGQRPIVLDNADKAAKEPMNGPAVLENNVWSPLEETIRDVLAEISGVPAEGILKSNNIYHLGLDSISAIKIGALLRKKDVAIGFRDMLKAGSIAEMSRLVRDTQSPAESGPEIGGNGGTNGVPIPVDVADLATILRKAGVDQAMVEEVLPSSPMQVHMLSVWQNTNGEVFYPCFTYSLSGHVDVSSIAAAWETLVAETPVLRTIFVATDFRSIPVLQLVVHPEALPPSNPSTNGTIWDSRMAGALSQPYNSLHAVKDGDRWTLQLNIHHGLYDAISLPTIMARFATLCFTNNARGSPLPAANWHSALALHCSEDNRAARKQFWTKYLGGVDSLPPFLESGAAKSRVRLVKPAALRGIPAIVELCKAKGVGLQALFFAAYAEFVASTTVINGLERLDDVVFGIYLANRAENNEPGAGAYPFLRLVPLRVELRAGASLFDLASEIQRDIHIISSPVNVEVGLWEIYDWTGIRVDSFVNFLGPAMAPAEDGHGDVRLELAEKPMVDSRFAPVESCEEYGETSGRELAGNPVRDAFPVRVSSSCFICGLLLTLDRMPLMSRFPCRAMT